MIHYSYDHIPFPGLSRGFLLNLSKGIPSTFQLCKYNRHINIDIAVSQRQRLVSANVHS